MKVKYRDRLSLDLSLGIITNESLHEQVTQFNPFDQETESVLQAVLICQEIQRQVSQIDS